MAPRKITIPFVFGHSDRVEPKFAPLGVLDEAINLRVRRDGRLGSRNGYVSLPVDDVLGFDMVAYDLHEYSDGRLIALGSSFSAGHPTELYEYTGRATNPWRYSDQFGRVPTVTPLTNPRQVCGIPQPGQGVAHADCAAGGGYVCSMWLPARSNSIVYIQVVRESDNQVVFARGNSQFWKKARVCFADGIFWFIAVTTSGSIELGAINPESSTVTSRVATIAVSGFSTNSTIAISAVSNPSDSTVIVAYADPTDATADVTVKRYDSSGNQEGSTLTIANAVRPVALDVECDEEDETVNVLINETDGSGDPTAVQLLTYNLSNTLLDGPTSLGIGSNACMCRQPADTNWSEAIGVAYTTSSGIEHRSLLQDGHTGAATCVIANATLTTRIVSAGTSQLPGAVVLGGITSAPSESRPTNVLWYISGLSGTVIHAAPRDLRDSAGLPDDAELSLGLSVDASTGRLAWQALAHGGASSSDDNNFSVTTLDLNSPGRRSSANVGGLLYLAGAPVQAYDGGVVSDVAFGTVPRIESIASDTDGALANGGTYSYVLHFEYSLSDGTFFRSPPSLPFEFETDDAGEDAADITVHGPYTAAVVTGQSVYGAQVTGVLSRTIWDSVNSSQGSLFHEVLRFECSPGASSYGADITVSDTMSDSDAATRAILYTQGGRVEDNAPGMATYLSASSSRLICAGLARQSEAQESKELQLDQGVHFSGLSAFFLRCPEPIVGAVALDGVRVLFGRRSIYTITGEGPGDDASGALPPPVELPTPGGLHDWRSLLEAPDGVWFQLDSDKLYRLPRGLGAPEWAGVDVRETLASYPVITGAARLRQDDAIAFAANNSAETDARIIVRSLRTGLWTTDTPPLQTSQGIEALCSFGPRIAYISGGIVYAMSESAYADGSSSVIVTRWRTHPIYPFEIGGNGCVHALAVTGEYRSAGTLALRISYDDGVSYETYDSFVLSGLTAGAAVHRQWSLERSDLQNIVVELTFTPSTAGEGLVINGITLLVEATAGLRDLDPSELA